MTTGGAAVAALFGETGVAAASTSVVVVVAARGSFEGVTAKRPSVAKVPAGSVLTIVFDVGAGQLSDWGIDDTYPELGALGADVLRIS